MEKLIYSIYFVGIISTFITILIRLRHKHLRRWGAIVATALVMGNAYHELDLYRGGLIHCQSWKYVLFACLYFTGFIISVIYEQHQIRKKLIEKGSWGEVAFEWYKLFEVPVGEDFFVEKLQAWTRKVHQSEDKVIFLTKVEGNTDRCPYESDFDKLFVIERGECNVEVRGQTKKLCKGDEIIIHRGDIHNFSTTAGVWIKVVVLKPKNIR